MDLPIQGASAIPLWIKLAFTGYLAVLVPVYWVNYTPINFLWFCDVALFMACVGLWLELPLLIGAAALATVLCDLIWIVDLVIGLITGTSPTKLVAYMLEGDRDLFLRGLSLFHIWFPLLLLWLLGQLGYDHRALPLQIAVSSILLPLSYLLTPGPDGPAGNVNRVFPPAEWSIHPWLWVGLLMLAYPVLAFLPSHFAFSRLFPSG